MDQKRLARKIASRWAHQQALGDWQPAIPKEARLYLQELGAGRVAYVPDTEERVALEDAQSSVGVMLSKILETLRKHQGDRYYMNASESHGKIFYFFSPRQLVDAFNLTLFIKDYRAVLIFGYTPYKLDGTLDFKNMKSERGVAVPEMAGMAVMRLVRSLLTKI